MPKKSSGSGRGRGRPKGSKTMKKVTTKGAYKSNVKNQMTLRRAPIVETKQRVASDIAHINGFLPGSNSVGNVANPLNWRSLVTDDAFTLIPLNSFYRQSRGLEEHQIIGSSLYSKFLNFKLQVQFPEGKDITLFSTQVNNNGDDPVGTPYSVPNKMIQESTKVYLITGWITQNMNCPVSQDVQSNGLAHAGQRPQRDQCEQGDLIRYISNQLRPYFDDGYDKLQFRPKETTNIKIDKYVRLKPDLSHAIGTQATPLVQGANEEGATVEYATGSIPQVNKSHNWKTNRKVHYTQGQNTSFSTDSQNLYPNDSWLPFAVIYNPDYLNQVQYNLPSQDPKLAGRFAQVQMMRYRFNDAHYYTDS